MLLLKQDIIKKEYIENMMKLDADKSKKYEIEPIQNSDIYTRESQSHYCLSLH